MHFIHLNVISPLPNIEEIHHLVELANAFVIDISESKLDGSVLNNEVVIEGSDLIWLDHARKGGDVACFIKYFVAYNYKGIMRLNTESIFTEMYLPKSKSFIVSIPYQPSDKLFRNSLEQMITSPSRTTVYLPSQ